MMISTKITTVLALHLGKMIKAQKREYDLIHLMECVSLVSMQSS